MAESLTAFNSDTQNIKRVNFMDYLKEFCIKLQNLDRSKNIATVFKDFLTCKNEHGSFRVKLVQF